MLETVKLCNFKSHRSTELKFDHSRLHALVGQNSSGKTSILQALQYLVRLGTSSFAQIFEYEQSPQFITTIGATQMSVTASGFWGDQDRRQDWTVSYQWKKVENPENRWLPMALWKIDEGQEGKIEKWSSSLSEADSPIPQVFNYPVYLKLVAANLAKPAYSDDITPKMAFDGSNFALILDYLRDETPDQFERLQKLLKQVVPGVQKVGLRRKNVIVNRQRVINIDGKSISYNESQDRAGKEVVLDMNTGERIPAHAISEGTLLALGLLTVLMYPKQANLVLLDDIDQGLHPKAQRDFVKVLQTILKENPNLQIIFSTHSPYIVDELKPSQVHVLSQINSGFSSCKRLDEHPNVEWAQQTLTTGEFWDAEGEDWVVAGEMHG
ncbi:MULTISPECIES: AAA family ATPase [unclassified Roseofilum]|uniref:AAA family ATPase n=1 Tax=unclassified Roseofilum TaxID=2620099 RepID=UPI000E9492ED|nr:MULTISPECIES: AAA family ATPase [unclassified Roseofilum]HBQ98033.1 ATPase [Cyanobacteria bacterium UBA11691]MBP0008516.1 AAA family ATPase [Roseofilum sp. Belize Diploria]MBP0012686.1 AAA family ATPase [Roseofilum sp. SID3]MBP0026347.1 AAA family ATPase [Roseofilum sp. SID2]MBP0032987.1 AAA family ATPase [Roseofilum sp. Belize BBD 4]